MNLRVRFEDEADAEYRAAGRWYEERRAGLGLEFFDGVDAAIGHVLELPRAGERVRRMPAELPVRRIAVKRFPYHVFYLEAPEELRILAVAHDRCSGVLVPLTRSSRRFSCGRIFRGCPSTTKSHAAGPG